MRNILVDVLLGILTIVLTNILEFMVTLPFGEPGGVTDGDLSKFLNREFLLIAIPAGLTTFSLTWLLKTKSQSDAKRRSVVWTILLALSYALVGLGNGNLKAIISTVGIYVLLACVFVGPLVYAKIKHLK